MVILNAHRIHGRSKKFLVWIWSEKTHKGGLEGRINQVSSAISRERRASMLQYKPRTQGFCSVNAVFYYVLCTLTFGGNMTLL